MGGVGWSVDRCRAMRVKIVWISFVLAMTSSLAANQYAWAGGLEDNFGVSVSRMGNESATGTIRTTTRAGGSNSSTSTRASSGQRPAGGQVLGGQSQSTGGGNAAGGGTGILLLTNFIPNSAAAPGGGVTVAPVVLARQAAATLELPTQTVRVGPNPSANQWNMLAVGYPLWLWREGAGTISESVSLGGASLSMTATYRSTTYDMGDGKKVTCTVSTPWVAAAQTPGTPSPTCGHSYSRPGTYTITGTHTWDLAWSGMGQSGSFPLTNVSSTTIEVGELASIVIGR